MKRIALNLAALVVFVLLVGGLMASGSVSGGLAKLGVTIVFIFTIAELLLVIGTATALRPLFILLLAVVVVVGIFGLIVGGPMIGIAFLPLFVTSLLIVLWALLYMFGTLPSVRPANVWSLLEIFFGVLVSMFSIDRWGEVFDTIRRNKLRTVLTCVSVAWGIFVMVVLLGLGQGLNNGIRHSFRAESANAVYISAAKTSIPFGGYGVGRRLTFNNRDFDAARKLDGIDHLGRQYFIHGGRFGGGEMKIQHETKSNTFGVNAISPATLYLDTAQMVQGRFINDLDIATLRKTVVIGEPVRDFLFGHQTNSSHGDGGVDEAIGEWIVIGGVPFEIVGIYHDENEESARQVYIPVSTAQLAFNGADRIGMLMFDVKPGVSIEQEGAIKQQVVDLLAESHQFNPEDRQAVRVFDNIEGFSHFQQFFMVISMFVLVIGLGTLAAGVVGVSNIMMIAVKERTREIGIRKALGATPQSIVSMIVQEAVFLTSIAGLLGLSAGVVFLGLLPKLIDTEMIENPSINIGVGVLAAVGLMIAGALAGFVPARSAAKVNPVETLRDA
ncbi:MAG: ABC transporter permease [Kofleriaceae bacterium]